MTLYHLLLSPVKVTCHIVTCHCHWLRHLSLSPVTVTCDIFYLSLLFVYTILTCSYFFTFCPWINYLLTLAICRGVFAPKKLQEPASRFKVIFNLWILRRVGSCIRIVAKTHYKLGLKAVESLNCGLKIIKTSIESSIDTDDKIVLEAKEEDIEE